MVLGQDKTPQNVFQCLFFLPIHDTFFWNLRAYKFTLM